jgi:hypothetical protein
VTYVDIYWVSPESVQIGYTPGYMGTVVTTDGTVVYGTGYDYTAWVGDVYYPPPPTYGYAVYPAFDVAEGAMFGYEMGFATDYFLAPAPVWGPVYYGYGDYWGYHGGYYPYGPYYGYNGDHYYNTGYENVYGHYGNTTYNGYHDYGYNPYTGTSGEKSTYDTYNSRTGTSSTIHSYNGSNAYTGNEAAGYNRQSLGLTFMGNFETDPRVPFSNSDGRYGPSRPTEAQLVSGARVAALWTLLYDIAPDFDKLIIPHRQISSKSCPGSNFPYATFRDLVRDFHSRWKQDPVLQERIGQFALKPYLFQGPRPRALRRAS